MRLGFTLRRQYTFIESLVRQGLEWVHYLIWLLFDYSKFKKFKTKPSRKILVVFRGATGDVYNILGILNQLVHKYPEIEISVFTNEKNRRFVKNPKLNILDLSDIEFGVNKKNFDTLVVLDASFAKKFKLLKKIPQRICVNFINIGGFFKAQFFGYNKKISPKIKGPKRFAEAFNHLGLDIESPRFYFTKTGERNANDFFDKYKISKNEKLIFLHAGSGTTMRAIKEGRVPSHKWPAERWAKVADSLTEKYNARIILTGLEEEKKLIKEITDKIRHKKKVINYLGKGTIEDTASILKRGDLLISIDTGMAHFGAQAGIPVIDLFGPFDPRLAGPMTDRKKILFHKNVCNRCRKYYCPEKKAICMNSITVKEVLEAAGRFIR